MKLKKHERHAAYIIMLAEVEEAQKYTSLVFLCHLAVDMLYPRGMASYWEIEEEFIKDFPRLLPELYSKKPAGKNAGDQWYVSSDYKSRIRILKQCIEETYEW